MGTNRNAFLNGLKKKKSKSKSDSRVSQPLSNLTSTERVDKSREYLAFQSILDGSSKKLLVVSQRGQQHVVALLVLDEGSFHFSTSFFFSPKHSIYTHDNNQPQQAQQPKL